ncbi:MAG: hypothetical protein GXP31_01915 [Kiritimatiellaeota bacterium]|nr:hypothetical protein [Kiritimatiellota bacterium]
MARRGMKMHVISHTHWDREWYMPFEQFRHRLVHLIDNLLDLLDRDPDFRCFHLDAQTVVLEDYLEIRPDNRKRLATRIREGRIHVGPWYVQNDEFLTSGEATVRNLLEGARIASSYGCTSWVGYIPDQFGNLSQLPQIFRGFGVDTALFGRGRFRQPDDAVEFWWVAPDGSRVLSVFMPFWYNNAQRLPLEPRKLRNLLTHLRDTLAPITPSGQLLLMNGVDHLEAQENLTGALHRIRKSWRLPPVIHSTLPEFFAEVKRRSRRLKTVRGELRDGADGVILNGTLSSRPYLKQANQRCEMLLERYLEPFALAAARIELLPWPGDRLRYLWKTLIKNQPHDSICGCSADTVHRDNENRFRHVEELAEDILGERLQAIALGVSHGGKTRPTDYKLVVFNPSPFPRTEIVTAVVDLLEEDGAGEPLLLDAHGRRLPCKVLSEKRLNKRFVSPVNLPGAKPARRLNLLFRAARVPALGYSSFILRPADAGRPLAEGNGKNTFENRHLAVVVKKNGVLTLTDKRTGQKWTGQHWFVDEGDEGDLYNFHPIQGDTPISTRDRKARIRCLERNTLRTVYEIVWRLELPCGVNFKKKRRRRKTAQCTIRSRLTLNRDEGFLRIRTEVRNQSRDHRLRVHFKTPDGAEFAVADCPFDVVARPSQAPTEWNRRVNVNPMRTFVAASNREQGLAILARGIYAQELTPEGTLALTLLRCTGRISAGDVNCPTEGRGTEDSQLLGSHAFDYAILPFAGDWHGAPLVRAAEEFALPIRAVQVPVDPKRMEGGRPWTAEDRMEYAFRTRPGTGVDLPVSRSFLTINNPHVALSALKQAEDRDSVIVRLFNPTDRPRSCTVRVGWPAATCWICRLDETRLREIKSGTGGFVRTSLKPKQILTLELARAGSGRPA